MLDHIILNSVVIIQSYIKVAKNLRKWFRYKAKIWNSNNKISVLIWNLWQHLQYILFIQKHYSVTLANDDEHDMLGSKHFDKDAHYKRYIQNMCHFFVLPVCNVYIFHMVLSTLHKYACEYWQYLWFHVCLLWNAFCLRNRQ